MQYFLGVRAVRRRGKRRLFWVVADQHGELLRRDFARPLATVIDETGLEPATCRPQGARLPLSPPRISNGDGTDHDDRATRFVTTLYAAGRSVTAIAHQTKTSPDWVQRTLIISGALAADGAGDPHE